MFPLIDLDVDVSDGVIRVINLLLIVKEFLEIQINLFSSKSVLLENLFRKRLREIRHSGLLFHDSLVISNISYSESFSHVSGDTLLDKLHDQPLC